MSAAIDPAPSEDEAAAIFAVLTWHAGQQSPPSEKVSRWRLAARAHDNRSAARDGKLSAWARAGRRYE